MHTENWETKNKKHQHTFTLICTSIAPIPSSRIPLQTCICVNTEPNEEWGARKWSLNTKMTEMQWIFLLVCIWLWFLWIRLHSIDFQSHAMENGHYEFQIRSARNIFFSFQHFELTIEQETVHRLKTENTFDKNNERGEEEVVQWRRNEKETVTWWNINLNILLNCILCALRTMLIECISLMLGYDFKFNVSAWRRLRFTSTTFFSFSIIVAARW